ncbi:DnaJ like chaperone protein [Xanthobacter flavus]|uniref:DnaJ like chaperone protein n=1 Tax=Xanthobacter flavus TaxID=281 RepID=A0A9W6CK71_XANFL|nr:molecular chaperone DjiA [Xanthobacter flavus]MDR6333541.1 DnaJ like chaperone protein [Xanthobacter flavus]NMN59218.1 DnaJ like chaperone protein [Xanthobacter sp. SG618]GLI20707.1 molecular chaperone DjlA [Xanthobacter flavus]
MAYGLIGGAGVGFALGGPLGALLGALAGHVIDRVLLAPAPKPAAFSIALIALSAKMAKADGVVVPAEVEAFREVFDIPPEDLDAVARLYNLAKQDTAGFEAYARQVADMFADAPDTREDLMDALFHVAKADHALHEKELVFLSEVGRILGFEGLAYERIEARHVRRPGDPYAVLDLDPGASDDDVKAHWRALVSTHHPDRLAGRGLPPAAIKLANDRVAALNAAYSTIARQRGL